MAKTSSKPGKGAGIYSKGSVPHKTNPDPQPSIESTIIEGSTAGDTDDLTKTPVDEEIQSSEAVAKGQEKEPSTKPKRSFADGIMDRFGYARKAVVSSYLTDYFKPILGEEMNCEAFARLSLEDQFGDLAKRINAIITSKSEELKSTTDKVKTLEDQVEELEESQKKYQQEVSRMSTQLSKNDTDIKTLTADIGTLQGEADKYKSALETLLDKKVSASSIEGDISSFKESYSKLTHLKQDYDDLYRRYKRIETELSDWKSKHDQLEVTNKDLVTKYGELKNVHENLQQSFNELEGKYNICKERCDELEACEVGQLDAIIKENNVTITDLTKEKNNLEAALVTLQETKKQVDDELNEVRESLAQTESILKETTAELATEKENVKNCNRIIKDKETEVANLTERVKFNSAKIEEQTQEIELHKGIIEEKTEEIVRLNKTKQELQGQINTLNAKVDSLEKDILKLADEKAKAEKQTKEKDDFISAERDEYAKAIIALAGSLSEISAKDFLGCCDEAFESNRISLQEKVAKPVRALMRELEDLTPGRFVSQKQLEDAYYSVIKEQLDTNSGLTRIAQWYAYSCVPFMLDQDRDDGLFVRQEIVKSMYSLATKLLGMVGIEYRIPILYVEQLSEDNIYDDVTGKRQLNIEYMCPTARRHKENIDCIDNSSIIIDVVEVGYSDNRGNNKKSQVII